MITRLNDDVELMSFFCAPRGGSLVVWFLLRRVLTQMEGCCHSMAVDAPRRGSDDKYL